MKRYGRYILRQLLGPFIVITLGLTAVVWLTQSLRFVDLIVNKGLSVQTFLHLTLLLLPSFLSVIAPVALFCAVLFTYNRLMRDSELISFSATGLSPRQLAAPALLLAGVVACVSYSMTLYFIPVSYRDFKERQFTIRSDYSGILLQEGVFTTLFDDVTVYVRARESDGELLGILIHDSRIPQEPITMMAERGSFVETESGPRFIMINGNRQQIDKEAGRLSLLYFDSYTLDLGAVTADPKGRWRAPRERFLPELLNPSDDPDDQNNRGKLWAEAHQRLASPLYSFALVAIALAALLSGQFDRRGQWRRLLGAVVAACVFEAVGLGLVSVTAKFPPLTVLIYLNVVVTIGGGLFVMMRRPWRRATRLSHPAGSG
ncbi:MAG: LPS export ABC transporter permease LptF [Proteobacteria bacterium]|nr:LPS export ABC transporter permease LptF [Pseudomonadota bacterium]